MKYISLFSGIGGFEHGIEKSNKKQLLKCIGYSEIDKYAENIYKKHYPNHPRLGDATKINTKELQDFDLLVGGFPCQAFSVAGKRRGFDDTRGTLFFEIARILEDKKPKYFLLENVKGLLSHDKGRTFQTILRTLSTMGYDVEWKIYNSKNYGVPQNRERIYIKGFLRERCGQEILSFRKSNTTINTQKDTRKLNQITKNKGQGQTVYDVNGLARTLCANAGGQGGKTGLYTIKQISENKFYPCTKNGDFFAVTTKPRFQEFHKKQDNYVFEKQDVPPEINIVGNVYLSGGQNGNVYSENGLMGTLGTSCGGKGGEGKKILVKNNTKKGYLEATEGDGIVYGQSNARGRVQSKSSLTLNVGSGCGAAVLIKDNTKQGFHMLKGGDGVSLVNPNCNGKRTRKDRVGTLTTHGSCGYGVLDGYTIRRLTPVECERLQGFPDNWTQYGADGSLISDTQRYKCCGNAVTTNVITYIFNEWNINEKSKEEVKE